MKAAVPSATYRVQLNSAFGLRDAAQRIPYLAELGISTVYCSPVLQARAGSMHGYDTVDPTQIGADIGGDEAWAELLDAAQRHGMTVLLDIVPNHMAASTENRWWRDILEHGRVSPFGMVFDIDWEPPNSDARNRVVLPLLSAPLEDVITGGELRVDLSPSGLVLKYGNLELPLDVRSYLRILEPVLHMSADAAPERLVRLMRALPGLIRTVEMPGSDPDLHYALRLHMKDAIMELSIPPAGASLSGSDSVATMVRGITQNIEPHSMRLLLSEQNYRLEYWKSGRHILNYRRFFDVNDLVGVRQEDEQVFEITHSLLSELARSSVVCGFRVDHVDGLRLPLQYLRRLRSMAALSVADSSPRQPYLVVEKILSGDEVLPPAWPVQGTTGYDFLNEVSGLFVQPSGLDKLRRHHRKITHSHATRANLTYDNKRLVLSEGFRPELSRLAHTLLPVARWLHPSEDTSVRQLTAAITEVTASLPIYRTYYNGAGPLADADRRYIEAALQQASERKGADWNAQALDVVRRALTLDVPATTPTSVRQAAREHLLRWQQLSGAAMAKGFEDTTLYQDSVLLALNNVGSRQSPGATTIDHFHAWNKLRQRDWPHTMNCTATHDAKRGEDARTRIAVLSDISDDWNAAIDRWHVSLVADDTTRPLLQEVDPATRRFLLQTIIGSWPENGPDALFAQRLTDYMTKVAREAKTHSSWLEPDESYEGSLADLISYIVTGVGIRPFRDCFGPIIETVRFHGLVNSLAQVLCKIACPGVPDFYQGTELLDLSFVDPDNRRPVDYDRREWLLAELVRDRNDQLSVVSELTERWPDERAKLYTTARALQLRSAHRDLFEKGRYTPLHVDGDRHDHVCAFMRSHKRDCVVVVAPLQSLAIAGAGRLPLGAEIWGNEAITLPPGSPRSLENVLTREKVSVADRHLLLSEVFASFPVALLHGM